MLYLVYRSPKGRYAGVMRSIIVIVDANSAAQAVRVANFEPSQDYAKAVAIPVEQGKRLYI